MKFVLKGLKEKAEIAGYDIEQFKAYWKEHQGKDFCDDELCDSLITGDPDMDRRIKRLFENRNANYVQLCIARDGLTDAIKGLENKKLLRCPMNEDIYKKLSNLLESLELSDDDYIARDEKKSGIHIPFYDDVNPKKVREAISVLRYVLEIADELR